MPRLGALLGWLGAEVARPPDRPQLAPRSIGASGACAGASTDGAPLGDGHDPGAMEHGTAPHSMALPPCADALGVTLSIMAYAWTA